MSDFVRAPEAQRPLNFVETLGVALAIYAAFAVGGWLTGAALFLVPDLSPATSSKQPFDQACWDSAVWIGASLWVLAVIWLAVRHVGWQFEDYLALVWPRRSELVAGLIVTFVLQFLSIFVLSRLGGTGNGHSVAEFQSARDGGSLFLLMATTCVVAPIVEEFAVRGFLFRGWSESFLGPRGTIALTSALWTVCHTQYNWIGQLDIFVAGLVLGYFRYRSGSTYLTVVMHSAINIFVTILLSLVPRSV